MAFRLAQVLLFALATVFSFYSLFDIVVYGRVHVRHMPRVWTYFANDPWTVAFYGIVYLIAGAAFGLLFYRSLVSSIGDRTTIRSTRPRTNFGVGQFFRAWLSSYLHPEK